MNKPKAFFIISRYKEDIKWIDAYTDNYIIYNKGEPILGNDHILNVPNIGGNQRDIFSFVYENYRNLPELMAFMQAFPFDHCRKGVFDNLIYNEEFTSLEAYDDIPESRAHKIDAEGGYLEINNSWYISSHNHSYGLTCKYPTFDYFMQVYFKNYKHVDWIRFAPGSQYIIEKRQLLHYPQKFWGVLMQELHQNNATEGHIIERALWMILQGNLELRKERIYYERFLNIFIWSSQSCLSFTKKILWTLRKIIQKLLP